MLTYVRNCLLIAVLVSVAQFGVSADKEKDSPEIGTWMGKNNDRENITVSFEKGGKLTIKIEPIENKFTYKVDWSKKPAHLDLTMDRDGKQVTSETIIELTKDGGLKIQETKPGKKRPTEFGENSFTLKKVESK